MPENPQDPAALKEKILADFNKSIGLDTPATSAPSVDDIGGYNPRPKAIDILNQFTGNTFTGPTPALTGKAPEPNVGNFAKDAANYVASMANSSASVDKMMKPFTYNADYDGANFERYYSHGKFAKLGFNPYRDNDALYNDNSTFGDEFARAASQWPSLIKSGFMSGARAWDTLFTDPLAPDLKGAKEMEKYMAIGSSSKKGAGSFAINNFLNSGYTIGIGGELLLEELALAGVTALSGGIASELTLPAMGARAASTAKKIAGVEKLKDLAKVEKLNDARSLWDTSVGKVASAAGRTLNPLENTFQYGKDIIQGEKYAAMAVKEGKTMANFAKFSDGFGSFARDVMMIKSAVGEAKLEGGSTQMNVTKDLIQKYRESHNGEDPSNEELTKIHGIAAEEAKRTALWNLPAIMWSNKFMYETVMRPFEKTATKPLKDIVFDPKKFADGTYYKKVGLGAVERTKNILRSLAKPKTYADFGLNYLKANVAEGVQENLQEAIAIGAASHAVAKYTNKDRGAYEAYMGHFMKGMGDQFSAQGLETFAGGFLMGAMAQPVMAAPTWLGQTVWNNTVNKKAYGEYKTMRDKQLDEQVTQLNEMYNDLGKYFSPEIANGMAQAVVGADYADAVFNGSRKDGEDAKDHAIFGHLVTALQTNTMDNFLDRFKELKGLSPEEAAQAFGVLPEQGQAVLDNMDKVINRAESLKKTWETLDSKFPNQFNPSLYPKGSEEYKSQMIGHKAWEEAKMTYLFAKSSYDRHRERLAEVAKAFTGKSAPIGNMNVQDLHVLLDPTMLGQHMKSLSEQIRNLDSNVPEQNKEKTKLQKEKDILEDYAYQVGLEKFKKDELSAAHTAMSADTTFEFLLAFKDKPLLTEDNARKFILAEREHDAKKAFRQYLVHKTKDTNEFLFDDKLDESFQLIKDHITLNNELGHLAKTINVLTSPEGFVTTFTAINKGLTTAFDDKEELVKERLREKVNVVELNRGFQRLLKEAGVYINPDYMDGFVEAIEKKEMPGLPTSFIKDINQEEITEGPLFDQATQIWKETLDLLVIKPKEKITEEPPLQGSTTETIPSSKTETSGTITAETPFSKYPAELQAILGPMMADYVEEATLDIDEPSNALLDKLSKEFLQTTKAQAEISKYNAGLTKETPAATTASVAFQITGQVKQELADLGYSKDDIYKMRPEEAQVIIQAQTTKPKMSTESSIEDKKDDIERRRQEELGVIEKRTYTEEDGTTFEIKIHTKGDKKIVKVTNLATKASHTTEYSKELSNEKIYEVHNGEGYEYSEIEKVESRGGKLTDAINNKYDAELAALEGPPIKKTEQRPGLTLNLGRGYSATYNKQTKQWDFYNRNNKIVRSQDLIERLSRELSLMPNVTKIWWNKFLSKDDKADIEDIFSEYTRLSEQDQQLDQDSDFIPELFLMEALMGVKFTPKSLKGQVTDVDLSRWTKEENGVKIDRLVSSEDAAMLRMDETDVVNALLELIEKYPKGINEKDLKNRRKELQPSGKLDALRSTFSEKYGLDIDVVFDQVHAIINEVSTRKEKTSKKSNILEKIHNVKTLNDLEKIRVSLPLDKDFVDEISITDIEDSIDVIKQELLKVISPENLKYAKENNLRVSYNDPKNPDISGANFAIKTVGTKFVTITKPSLTLKVPVADVAEFITNITDPMEETPVTTISAEAKITAKDNLSKEKEILDKKKSEAADMIKKVKAQPKQDTDNNLLNKLC